MIEAAFSTTLRSGEGAAREPLSDFDRIRNFVWSSAPSALLDIVWAPLFILAVFMFHPLLGLVTLGGSAVLVSLAAAHHAVKRPSLEEAGRKAGDARSFIERSLRSAQTLEGMEMPGEPAAALAPAAQRDLATAGEGRIGPACSRV